MKKQLFSLLAIGAMTIGLASCSSEEPAVNSPATGEDGEGIGYMSFTIANPTGSRATIDGEVYDNGDTNEYAICPNNLANAAFFFDASGNFYGMSNLQAFNNTGMGHGHTNGYPEQYYTYITRWRNTSAAATPTQAIVILNADPAQLEALAQAQTDLDTFLAKEYTTFTGNTYTYGVYNYGGADYFTMSNSAFMDGTEATVTDISGKVCETAEEALQNPATVYVERLLAKYQLIFNTEDGAKEFGSNNAGDIILKPDFGNEDVADALAADGVVPTPKVNYVAEYLGTEANLDYPSYEPVKWSAYVVNWGINGLEKNARLIKDINGGATNYFNGWNSTEFHRSFWGQSPDYATEEGFTTQYRYAGYDAEAGSYTDRFFGNAEAAVVAGDYKAQLNTLHYISFNDVKAQGKYKYTAERTYNAPAGLVNYGPYQYASHYLIAAQLLLEGVDTELGTKNANNQYQGVSDKYYAYNYYFGNKDSYIRYAYRRMATQVTDGRAHEMTINGVTNTIEGVSDGFLYADENGTRIEVANANEYFDVQPAQTIHGDGKVALKALKPIFIKTATGYTELSDAQVTNMIYSFAEPAKHFSNGAMYYAIPVQHMLGKSNSINKVAINKDNGEYAEGQFGTVRNHWYQLTVSAIGNVGTPVDNPDQPIIPDPEDEYYVALEIVILPWHVIDNGSVVL